MAKPPLNQEHADQARRAIAACNFDPHTALKDTVKDILVDFGHLCDAENIDFVMALKRAINTWAVERIDPQRRRRPHCRDRHRHRGPA